MSLQVFLANFSGLCSIFLILTYRHFQNQSSSTSFTWRRPYQALSKSELRLASPHLYCQDKETLHSLLVWVYPKRRQALERQPDARKWFVSQKYQLPQGPALCRSRTGGLAREMIFALISSFARELDRAETIPRAYHMTSLGKTPPSLAPEKQRSLTLTMRLQTFLPPPTPISQDDSYRWTHDGKNRSFR
jgi:hypothetical protein